MVQHFGKRAALFVLLGVIAMVAGGEAFANAAGSSGQTFRAAGHPLELRGDGRHGRADLGTFASGAPSA